MFRNFTIALAVVAVGFVGLQALPASAQTADMQSQIDRLLAQIRELTAEINRLRGIVGERPEPKPDPFYPGVKHRICGLLARDLAQGSRGDDVQGLQEFLSEQGFFSGNPTGFFGPLTAQAVSRWQSQEGVLSVGRLGPVSRERIMKWCGGDRGTGDTLSARPTRGEAPLTVSFYTKISGFRPQTVWYMIDFGDGTSEKATDCFAPADACVSAGTNTHTYTQNGSYTATLQKVTDPCPDDGDPTTPRCMAAIQHEIIGKVRIQVGPVMCTKDYRPVCGAKPVVCITTPCNPIPTTYSNICMLEADGARLLYEGQCRSENPADDPQCKSWYDGCNTCSRESVGGIAACTLRYCAVPEKAYCTAWFDSDGNRPPTISGFSGPTTLSVNQSGTWSVSASDPENGSLSYQIIWGDENQTALPTESAAADRAFVQSTTFTHAYANAGTYRIILTVRDSVGKQARTTATVKVTGAGTVCTGAYAPVCGRPVIGITASYPGTPIYGEPQTYPNRCEMNRANASFLYEGQCSHGY